MTPAQMFDGDLYVLASDAVQMAKNAYKNGQTNEREACARVAEEWLGPTKDRELHIAKAIRARGQE